jgi:hypothetical protein
MLAIDELSIGVDVRIPNIRATLSGCLRKNWRVTQVFSRSDGLLQIRRVICSLEPLRLGQQFLHEESLMPWRIVIECAEDLIPQ